MNSALKENIKVVASISDLVDPLAFVEGASLKFLADFTDDSKIIGKWLEKRFLFD